MNAEDPNDDAATDHPAEPAADALARPETFAMVPSSQHDSDVPMVMPVDSRLTRSVRLALVSLAAGLIGVFGIAAWLKPDPRGLGTHQQLGLPPCTFQYVTGLPCPSCGMTTSFSHMIRGQVIAAAKANPVGALLAATLLVAIPYCLLCAATGRRWGIADYETFVARGIAVFVGITFLAWLFRLGVHWLG